MDEESCAEWPKHRILQLHNTLSVLPNLILGEAFPSKTHFAPLVCSKSTLVFSTPHAPQHTHTTHPAGLPSFLS